MSYLHWGGWVVLVSPATLTSCATWIAVSDLGERGQMTFPRIPSLRCQRDPGES